jgi:hypothetical protein
MKGSIALCLEMALFSCFTGVLLLLCNPVYSDEKSEIEAAINSGLAWVMAHPATYQDGGFPDIVDEALFYSTVQRLSFDKAFDSLYEHAFENCISRLEAALELEQRKEIRNNVLLEHYHRLLATYLIELVRKTTVDHGRVVAEAQHALVNNRYENPTFRLTVAVLLARLGAAPQVNMSELLNGSLINRSQQLFSNPGQPLNRSLFQHPLAYYAIVHEVAALTDFGRLPVPPWLVERRSHIGRILQEGLRQAMIASDIDLLAETILCNDMLRLPLTGELRRGVDFLLAAQRTDGSWGEQNTHRTNRTRHAAQTATAALLAYKTTRQLY